MESQEVKCRTQGCAQWTAWPVIFCVLLGAALGLAFRLSGGGLISDEGFHGAQIWHIYDGHWEILENITMIPGYHAVLAMAARALNFYHDNLHRTLTLFGALALPWLAWRMVASTQPAEAGQRSLQVFYFPLLFPFCFMIYTDAWAGLAVLAVVFLALQGRTFWAALAGVLAFLLRQDTIIWSALALWLVTLDGVGARLHHWPTAAKRVLRNTLLACLPLWLLMGAFVAFVVWNKGVAVGDRSFHQPGLTVTNAYSFLIWSWFMFLPQNLQAVPRIARLLLRKPVILLIVLLVGGFFLYMGTYSNVHPYNQENLRLWLHNELLYWLTQSVLVRSLAFVLMAWMVLTACVTRFEDARLYWLYPTSLVSAAMHPLIEPRYYLPAMLLFQLWRPALSERWENLITLYGMLLSVLMLYGLMTTSFYP